MATITAHCLVKNEEVFIGQVIGSVIDYVDKIIVFDTGSTDKTIEIIRSWVSKYPDKITFEERGVCDGARHTSLRQEMVDKTETDWFMILDGDEVWTDEVMKEALSIISSSDEQISCLIAGFYLCVGDIFHETVRKGQITLLGKTAYHYPRFLRCQDIKWLGDYNSDTLINTKTGQKYENASNTRFLKNKYWHLTHLKRSSLDDNDYSSGGSRAQKRRETYFLIGRKINENLPETLRQDAAAMKLSFGQSFVNFCRLWWKKSIKKI